MRFLAGITRSLDEAGWPALDGRTVVYDGPGHVLRLPWADIPRGVAFTVDTQTAEWLLAHPRVNVSEPEPAAETGEGHTDNNEEADDGSTA